MKNLLISQCDVFQFQNGQPVILKNHDILIEGNLISEIRPSKTPPDNVEIINGRNMLAIPGLINTHAHVPMSLFRGVAEDVTSEAWFNDYIWPMESNLTEEDVYWGALLGQAEMIENGITTVADRYFFMDRVAEAVVQSGIRANLVWTIFSHEGKAKVDQTCEFVEAWQGHGNGRITTWLGPHSPYTTTPEFLSYCAQKASELNVGIHIHVSETQKQVNLSLEKHGKTPVALLADSGVLNVPTILGHCSFPTDDDIKLLAQAVTGVAHAPKTYMKKGKDIVNIGRFQEANIPVGIATDGAASSSDLNILEQMRLMALAQKMTRDDASVMSIAEVYQLSFKGSAAVMQMPEKIGELAPGKLADVVLIDQSNLYWFPPFNPLANLLYTSHATDVQTVICDGKILMQDRQLLTIDKEKVIREITPRLDRLYKRIPGVRIADYPT